MTTTTPTRKDNAGRWSPRKARVAARGAPLAPAVELKPVEKPHDDIADKARGEIAAMLLWLALWLFNGGCTIYSWTMAMRWLSVKVHQGDRWWFDPIFHFFVGVVVHILVSSIEQHNWRTVAFDPSRPVPDRLAILLRSVKTWESVAVGGLDSLSTANALLGLALFLGAARSGGIVVACAVLGTGIAMASEPMLRFHGFSLKTLIGR